MERKYSFEQVEEKLTCTHRYDSNNGYEEYRTELNSLFREMKIAKLFDNESMYNSVIDQWVSRFENYWFLTEDVIDTEEEL